MDFGSFYDFPHLLDRMMGEVSQPYAAGGRQVAFPPLYIGESDGTVVVRALIPGARLEDVELTLTDKMLVLKGELKPVQGKYYRQERPTGPFQRVVRVNVPVSAEDVRATMKDGVLEVVLPKTSAVRPQAIRIESR
ncbi:Hsp20/alpha crystallin family protein [Desulfovibrio psychrotolerans]|uniref:Molecular chaperone Hsp20 n=1 Tax=Desulfovibrio psychrotolerans TaxID=415242 RepID=A0A7J0BSU0_9BACT|nr:Hsp20/alpha crystallin family protein [Desulfovibrio psychrotolerans]GFM36783.1 molecular chaperone Hsp20 [Desulfovibrio psychrotolerans]